MRELVLGPSLPAELSGLGPLYVLGVGGPEDESGLGHVEAFVWRFAVLERSGAPPLALGFTSMPRLMAFTREINGQRQGSVPTEALKVVPGDLVPPIPASLLLDPEPTAFLALAGGASLRERRIPELEGARPA